MTNRLKMAVQQTIQGLRALGWSYRRIARELGVHRDTVSRQIRAGAEPPPKPAIPPPGSEGGQDPKPAIPPAGSDPVTGPAGEARAAIAPAGKAGRASVCEGYRDKVQGKLEAGLSAQRIWQDLAAEDGYTGSYDSVKRYVRKLSGARQLPFRRMERAPGEEAQVDFGTGGWVEVPGGKRRRPHVFRIVLSHSRKGYAEAVWRQTTESFLRCIENAFWAWGGAVKVLVIDNLKAGVLKADWYDPELNPKIEVFARHYGTVVMPTKAYTPRHKGKVERGVGYVQENALRGRRFASLEEQNLHLREWEAGVADLRIHGTTRKQVRKLFLEEEKGALLPLPEGRFPSFEEGQRSVHYDGHVEVAKAYYSVPPEYVHSRVWVRWDSRVVRVYNLRLEPIATHARTLPGRFRTHQAHLHAQKISRVERGAEWLLRQARAVGPETASWAEAMLKERGIEGVRVLVGLLSLARKHEAASMEQACRIARGHGSHRLKAVRGLIDRRVPPPGFDFMEEHPVIRPLAEYGEFVKDAIERRTS